MNTTTIILLIMIGLAAGFLSGLVGIGGGIIIVPALVFLLGFTQKQAQGTSLGIMLLPIGILAVIQYYKQGYLNVNYVLIVACAFVVGGFLGSKLALSLSDEKMKKVFAVILFLISLKMLFFDKTPDKKTSISGHPTTVTEKNNHKG
ncbi:MAG: sulfite exporter TauE/SafE family protein [Sediminibacterium sp.]|jgi:uncharacterized protein|uniref:sulfite exporter TauE/SafE family protein n=1 Tax=Sediminibacterium sp. TaxID=1917865 RepID=UPI002ABA24C9|nr:sulfite exporter TauE/SafE family protein [Sediminibacterium sp.]MDZ4070400.1 sulfite exporter TauE/SafE family protein [Sediminibacterium sp.]